MQGRKKQHKHILFVPDFLRTFLTLTPGRPWVKKFLPITGAAEKRRFWYGRPRFLAQTSMTRRVFEKLCTKKVCVDFLAPKYTHLFLRILFSFFCPVHPTPPQATFFPRILSCWDLRSTLSSIEKATSRGSVVGTVLDEVAPRKKGKSFLFFFFFWRAKKGERTTRHIIITRAFLKARNITHKITPALLTNIFQEFFSLGRNRVFHEKFESQNYTLWGCTPDIFGESISTRITHDNPKSYTKKNNRNLISNSFVTKGQARCALSDSRISSPLIRTKLACLNLITH